MSFGWSALLFYLTCGIVLEGLHGFKVGWYLDVGYETRRLMFTLGHAHGTLFSLVAIVAGVCERSVYLEPLPARSAWALQAAVVLLPLSFFAGGFGIRGGDPGLGIWIAPIGALFLFYAIFRIARHFKNRI